MGIRPEIFTVFGIDNYKGLINRDVLEKQVYIPDDAIKDQFELSYVRDAARNYATDEWRYYYDLVYISADEFDNSEGIVGYKLSSGDYDSDTFRAMAMLYPEFMESGHKDIPYITDEDKKAWRWRHRQASPCGGIEFQQHWFYEQGMYWLAPAWAFITKWLLDSLGIETSPAQYKWMLVWTWS